MVVTKKTFQSFPSRSLSLIGLGLLLLIGCQKSRPKGLWFEASPRAVHELGIIVDKVEKSQIAQLVAEKRVSARALSEKSGTYEIYGLNLAEIAQQFPGKAYLQNEFLDFNDPLQLEYQIAAEPPSPLPQLQIIKADSAWRYSQGQGVKIAVIDTGLAWDHQDFTWQKQLASFNSGWNFGDGNADLTDPTGHGTAVAGLIASFKLGVAPQAQIIPLKVINSAFKIDEGSVIAAIRFALENQISLIHFSLGSPSVSEVFLNLLKEVENQGALIIAASGNQGRSCDLFKQYPAGIDSIGVLSIGATLLDAVNPFQFASYSNFGDCVSLAAPGGSAEHGLWAPLWENSTSSYRTVVGTSMAAPLATGAAAINKSLHSQRTGLEIKNQLLESAQKSSELEGYVKSSGLLQIIPISVAK